jgi:hypothetical protein
MPKSAKTPQEKKKLSLKKDRRNVYGENDKASRKGIPRSKQLSHMAERRAVQSALAPAKQARASDIEIADEVQFATKTQTIQGKRKAFRKTPDVSLGVVLKRKGAGNGKWQRATDETEFVPLGRSHH